MNKRQYARHEMIVQLRNTCSKYEYAWKKHAAFAEAVQKLEAPLMEIMEALKIQSGKITGITKTKVLAREKLVDTLMILAGGVFAYAYNKKDEVLMSSVKLSRSHLLKIRDVEVVPICRGFYEEAMKLVVTDAALERYGVDLVGLEDLKEKIEKFDKLITLPRQAIGYRANATKVVDEQIRKCLNIIENELDMMVMQFKVREKDFYDMYRWSRKMKKERQKEKEIENEEQGETVQIAEKAVVEFEVEDILERLFAGSAETAEGTEGAEMRGGVSKVLR